MATTKISELPLLQKLGNTGATPAAARSWDFAYTWNDAGTTFTALYLNITNTASAAASKLVDLQVGGVSKFNVRKDGAVTVNNTGVRPLMYGTCPDIPGWNDEPGVVVGNETDTAGYLGIVTANEIGVGALVGPSFWRGTLAAPQAPHSGDVLGSFGAFTHDGIAAPTFFLNPYIEQIFVADIPSAGRVPIEVRAYYGDGTDWNLSITYSYLGVITISGALNTSGPVGTAQAAPTIASSATIAPTTPITFISGVTDIDTITPPTTFSTTGGELTLIPTGIWHLTTAGNIALVATAVVSKPMRLVYDSGTSKWYHSY